MRIQAIESLVALGERRGVEALDATLDWAAGIAADESEDWDLRVAAANTLLDFPRARDRALLENLAAQQSGMGRPFLRNGCAAGVFRRGHDARVA